ncbi:hypothetical protein ACTGVN_01875 [Streptococcus suis]|nr:hypothetical protein [Streptococcus suis]MBY5038052.1 hypothetical protein [Streptococcus suis]MCK3881900.1 hypothetical protein [Streptococcus suis]HEM5989001.1 hypothetical protein [Streptococcus suis]HEM6346029.1 hypothetical protein [Streptococcus suis]
MISSDDLYCNELAQALLKESKYQIEARVAHQIARQYASQVEFEEPILMHVGINSIASNLIEKIKPEYFQLGSDGFNT